jgi:hypothetical protein
VHEHYDWTTHAATRGCLMFECALCMARQPVKASSFPASFLIKGLSTSSKFYCIRESTDERGLGHSVASHAFGPSGKVGPEREGRTQSSQSCDIHDASVHHVALLADVATPHTQLPIQQL